MDERAAFPSTTKTGREKKRTGRDRNEKAYLGPISMRRFGPTKDIAQVASDQLAYVIGLELPVDGGWTMA